MILAALLLLIGAPPAARPAPTCPVGRHVVAAFQGGLPVWDKTGAAGTLSATAGPLPTPLTIVSCSDRFYFFMSDGVKKAVERGYVRTDQAPGPDCSAATQVGRNEADVQRGGMGAADGGLCPGVARTPAPSVKH